MNYKSVKVPEEAEELKVQFKNWKEGRIEDKVGFFPIWNDFKEYLSYNSGLSGGALRLYLFLGLVSKNKTGESFYSVKRLASELECSKRSIHKWLKELKSKELIDRVASESMNSVTFTILLPYPNDNDTK